MRCGPRWVGEGASAPSCVQTHACSGWVLPARPQAPPPPARLPSCGRGGPRDKGLGLGAGQQPAHRGAAPPSLRVPPAGQPACPRSPGPQSRGQSTCGRQPGNEESRAPSRGQSNCASSQGEQPGRKAGVSGSKYQGRPGNEGSRAPSRGQATRDSQGEQPGSGSSNSRLDMREGTPGWQREAAAPAKRGRAAPHLYSFQGTPASAKMFLWFPQLHRGAKQGKHARMAGVGTSSTGSGSGGGSASGAPAAAAQQCPMGGCLHGGCLQGSTPPPSPAHVGLLR